jgi:L-lactate dehydrogenase complex protein LldE
MADPETCCGFGGTFSVKFPSISVGMGQTKLDNIRAADAEYVVSNDLSCLMHLTGLAEKQGRSIKALHLAEVLVRT